MTGQVLAFNRAELQVISAKEAAAMLGSSEMTLRRMRAAKIGPSWVQISPGRLGYRLGALRSYLEAQEQRGGSGGGGKVALAVAA